MKFHRLLVRDFRGISPAAQVSFPERGIVVLEGDNELGKSSLMEAVDVLLTFKDSSQHRRVLDAHPIHRDAAPFVELEASSGPYRFVFAKQWARKGGTGVRGSRGSTTLRLMSPRVENFTGAQAEARAMEIIDQTLDRPLWEALRLLQGDSLDPVALAASSSLRAALDASAGSASSAGEGAQALMEAVEGEYRRFFTATGRPTGEYDRVLKAVTQAQHEYESASDALAHVEREVQARSQVEQECQELATRLARAVEQRDGLAEQAREVAARRAALTEAERTLAELIRDDQDALQAVATREELIAQIQTRRQHATAAEAEVDRHRDGEQRTRTLLTQAREQARQAQVDSEQARARVRAARKLLADAALRAEHSRLAQRLERVDELSGRLAAARARREALTVDAAALRRVVAAEQAVDGALIAQRAATATVVATPLDPSAVVLVDGRATTLSDTPTQWQLTTAMSLTVPGVVEMSLQPAADSSELAATVDSARHELAGLLAQLAVGSVGEAVECSERRAHQDSEIDRIQMERRLVLDGDDADELRERLTEIAALVATQQPSDELSDPSSDSTAPDLGSQPPGADTQASNAADDSDLADVGDLATAEACEAAALAVEASAAQRVVSLGAAAEDARVVLATAQAQVVAAERELRSCEATLAAARALASDDDVRARLLATQACVVAARQGRDEAAGRIHTDWVEGQFEAAERAVEGATTRVREAQERRARLDGVLSEVGSQGRADAAAAASDAFDAAKRAQALATREAEAVSLLRETLRRHRDQAQAAYVEPFRTAVERLGRVVYGPGFGVVVGADLDIEARVLDGVRVPFASLSTGAKEQLGILARLACATIVAADEGVPVVIDDALGHSDPQRILATSAAFAHVAANAQVIMLTCTPGRYDSVPGAQMLRMADLLSAETGGRGAVEVASR